MGKPTQYESVLASPVKSFFVSTLTRDIRLEEAILDLLDNCVDGILRTKRRHPKTTPYAGYWAEICFDKTSFSISDNCGGIPWSLHGYAFRMGRAADKPADPPGTVGVYGIGMKRAIFKMGKSCLIETQNGDNRYDVEIDKRWIEDEDLWHIPVAPGKKKMKEDGTTIVVGDLLPGVVARFHDDQEAFSAELHRMVATHYAFIIDKGFEVRINGRTVKPKPTRLVFSPPGKGASRVRPFVFKTRTDGVEIFLAVGFTRPIPSAEEVRNEQEKPRYSSIEAGWTVVCNDRTVLYCDRTELTGWGEAGVPRYHTQFIAISGIVELRADDAAKLPTTTTKRGIDASSRLYLQVKNKMREGMRIFIDFTNRWKDKVDEAKGHIAKEPLLSFDEVKREADALQLARTRQSALPGQQYRPSLPSREKTDANMRRISFLRSTRDVRRLANYLFDDENKEPSEVGGRCFDLMLKQARR